MALARLLGPERAVRDGDVVGVDGPDQHRAQAGMNDFAVGLANLDPVANAIGPLEYEDKPGDQATDLILDGKTDRERCGSEQCQHVLAGRFDEERHNQSHRRQNDDEPEEWNPGQRVKSLMRPEDRGDGRSRNLRCSPKMGAIWETREIKIRRIAMFCKE